MNKLYGYAGKLLRVDLTNEQTVDERLDEETARKYIGGTGLGAKYLYEEVPAGVEWSDEGNRLIIATGPLGGTAVGGSGTFSVVTKGALTNGAVASQANGFFGAFLKFSGYDGIILQGRAKRWVYLYIHNGRAELRDASHLLGKDTWDTGDLIRTELGQDERRMSVVSIGPAGENLVKFASIFADKGHTASHGGAGAVMGSKKLKAIAVARASERPSLVNKEGVSAIAKQLHELILSTPGLLQAYKWGTLNGVHDHTISKDGILPVKNYTTTIYDIEPEKLEKFGGPYIRSHFEPKPNPCWGCRMHHCHMITITEGPFKGYTGEEPEYECFAAFGPVIGGTDVATAIYISNEVDRMGMDCNEAGWVIGLVMECYEKGILSREECDGLEMNWGNAESTIEMLRRIAGRQGFGDVLAEGAMRAARRIGGEAPNLAIYTMKGNTPRGHDHRNRWPMLFDTCLSQMSTDEGLTMLRPADLGLSIRPSLNTNNSPEDALVWNAQCKGAIQFEDCLGVCRFTTRTHLKLLAEAVSASTGWNFPIEETMEVGRRVVNLLRAFNIRHGHTAEMDAPSPRYGSAPVDGPSQGKTIMDHWDELRSRYYELMGWDSTTGKPLPDTLKRFGLEHTIPELWEGNRL
ncbi:aldehyde ferredoxin oxidoreductase family protein [Chloroflexota bacterium]